MLDQLARMGWLRRRGVEYELGGKLVEMGILTLYQNKFDYVVAPLLYELQRVTGHAVHLGVLDGNDVLYLQKIETQSGPVLQTRAGGRIPARLSTIGKALLAATPRQMSHPPAPAQTSTMTARWVSLTEPATRVSIALGCT
jgi:DNA-binding IclR family transcriptional regulator